MGAKVDNVPPGILFKAVAADGSVDEKPDIDGGKQALMLIGQLVVSEAQELAAGHFDETHDIALLLEAMSALKCWLSMERSNLMASTDEDAMCGGCGCCALCYGAVMCSAAEKALLSAKERNDLPDSAFAYIEPGGKKDADGKTTPRSKRHYPIHDKAHADNAMARIEGGGKFGDEARRKVKAAQRKFSSGDDDASKATAATDGAVVAEEATTVDTEAIEAAVAKALAPSQERITALEGELAKAQADLTEMAARPIHGGPVLSAASARTAAKADGKDHAAEAERLEGLAKTVSDPSDAAHYRQLAARERAQIPAS